MTDRAHQNFLNVIQGSVGRSASGPEFSWNRYPERRGEISRLSSGNDEYEYFWRDRQCIVYWEVDTRSSQVLGVRFKGTPDYGRLRSSSNRDNSDVVWRQRHRWIGDGSTAGNSTYGTIATSCFHILTR